PCLSLRMVARFLHCSRPPISDRLEQSGEISHEGQDHMLALSVAALAAGRAGFSRGFAAFGAAMIYIPLVTLAYDAKTAVVTIFLVDIAPALPLIWNAAPQCDRQTISWMAAGAVALSPIGVALLLVADPMQ